MLGINSELSPEFLHEIFLIGGSRWADFADARYRLLDLQAAAETAYRCRSGYEDHGCRAYSDVAEGANWSYDSIRMLSCNCILEGYPDGTVHPFDALNRPQALKIALKAAFPRQDFSMPPTSEPLPDVQISAWYATLVDFAIEEGLIEEGLFITDGDFAAETLVRRGEIIEVLGRAAATSKVEHMKMLAEVLDGDPSYIYDDVPADHPYYNTIAATSLQCIVSGYGDGNFGVDDILTREQMAKVGCLAIYGAESELCGDVVGSCEPRRSTF